MEEEVEQAVDGFATALRDAIAARSLTLVGLRDQLTARGCSVSLATLSYWRSGERTPDPRSAARLIAELEDLLGLPADQLMGRLPPSDRRDRHQQELERMVPHEVVTQTWQALGVLDLVQPTAVSVQTCVDIGADRSERRSVIRVLAEAGVPGTSRFRYLVTGLRPEPRAPQFTARHGCTLLDSHYHRSGRAFGAIFALDRLLNTGESTLVEFQVDFPDGWVSGNAYQHVATHRAHEIFLWVRFDAGAVPDHYEVTTSERGNDQRTVSPLRGEHSIHVYRRSFGPGTIDLNWHY